MSNTIDKRLIKFWQWMEVNEYGIIMDEGNYFIDKNGDPTLPTDIMLMGSLIRYMVEHMGPTYHLMSLTGTCNVDNEIECLKIAIGGM
jgi:hypothetical protein